MDIREKWIPVTERMPEQRAVYSDCDGVYFDEATGEFVAIDPYTCYESEPVLVYGYMEREMNLIVATYCTWKYDDCHQESGWRDTGIGGEVCSVTHWMPLTVPIPPEKGADT